MKPFRSFQNLELVNQPEQPPTREEMAAEHVTETCLRLKELRAEALAREQAAEAPMVETPELLECYRTLDSMMHPKSRTRWIALPIIMEHFPELARPVTPAEQAAVDQYLANKSKGVTA